MTRREATRRLTIRRLGAVLAVVGSLSTAGCPRPNRSVFDDAGEDDDGGSSASLEVTDPGPVTSEPDYGDWFEPVDDYDGTVVYQARRDEVPVAVGAPGNGGDRAFDPPAVAVARGTTVRWEWTGEGGQHDVAATDGTFDSGPPEATRSEPFTHTFTEADTYLYQCTPHGDEGMRGAVAVYEPDD